MDWIQSLLEFGWDEVGLSLAVFRARLYLVVFGIRLG
jgi:hypothetical protein